MQFYTVVIVGALFQIGAIVCTVIATRMNQKEGDARHAEIISYQERAELLLVQRNKSLREKLWEKYPFGYVLFGSSEGNIVSLPFYDGRLFTEAHWEETRIEVSEDKKTITLTVIQPKWKSTNLHVNVSEHAKTVVPNRVGESFKLGFVYATNQPQMFFEVLDQNPRTPVYVIGFK